MFEKINNKLLQIGQKYDVNDRGVYPFGWITSEELSEWFVCLFVRSKKTNNIRWDTSYDLAQFSLTVNGKIWPIFGAWGSVHPENVPVYIHVITEIMPCKATWSSKYIHWAEIAGAS